MSETCVCGGSTAQPNEDCERCQLIATITALRTELAEAKQRLSEVANAQLNACTTECIDGAWWAKGNGIVAGPQVTEREVLLEVAENWWRGVAEAKQRVAELEEAKWWNYPPTVNGWFFMSPRQEDWDIIQPVGVSRYESPGYGIEYKITWSRHDQWFERSVLEFPDAVWWGPIPGAIGRPDRITHIPGKEDDDGEMH